jgi:glycosyltransferase involved in cell wall biosynthesis
MCLALQEQGIDVLLVTTDAGMNPNGSTRAVNREPQTYKGVPTIFFPVQWGDSFKYSRPLANWLEANIQDFDVAHIHAVFNHACIAAAKACRRKNVPYVIRPLGTIDPWSMKQKPLRKMLFWQLAAKQMVSRAAAVQYTAAGEQEAAEQSLGLNHGVVVPLGVDPNFFGDREDKDGLRQRFPVLNNHPYVLALSRLHPKKGMDVLIDAFLPLMAEERFRQWRLVLAGDGPGDYVTRLQQKVTKNQATDRIIFTGWIDGSVKASALKHASLLVLPSHHENFGLCVVESLACGVPVLVSPHVNLSQQVEAAEAGWVAEVDSEKLRESLTEILLDQTERRRRGDAGKQLAREFAWPKIAITLVDLYQRVLENSRDA